MGKNHSILVSVFLVFPVFSITSVLLSSAAFAAPFPAPPSRTAQQQQISPGTNPALFNSDQALEELRIQFPNLQIPKEKTDPARVQWVSSDPQNQGTGARYFIDPFQVARYDDFYDYYEFYRYYDWYDYEFHDQMSRELRDARLAQHWLDVREDLTLRDIDNKALELVREFASAQHAVPPVPGIQGAVTFNFGDHIPRIVSRPNRVTNIMLQPGERVTAIHAGDTTRWQFSPAVSGSGDNETVHIIVKPLVPDISTNLLIMTDRRTYNLDLVSSSTDFIPSVRFSYPDDTMNAWGTFIAQNRARRQNELVLSEGRNLSPENLNFDYEIVGGNNVPWRPVRVFDDGERTFIEMPARFRSMEAPVLMFYEGRQQRLVNYRIQGRFYIVDRLITNRAVLIAGRTRVVIQRNSGRN